jgi:hypothetical protein
MQQEALEELRGRQGIVLRRLPRGRGSRSARPVVEAEEAFV